MKEKYKDIGKIILVSVFSTFITWFFKELEQKNTIERNNIKEAYAVFYDVVDTCNRRHYYALRFIKERDEQEAVLKYKQYENMVIYYNETRMRNFALLEKYFGKECLDLFLTTLNKDFGELHNIIKDKDKKKTTELTNKIENQIYELSDTLKEDIKEKENANILIRWFN